MCDKCSFFIFPYASVLSTNIYDLASPKETLVIRYSSLGTKVNILFLSIFNYPDLLYFISFIS